MAMTMATATMSVTTGSQAGSLSSPLRRTTNHSTMTTASATHPMSSWVMPEVMWPKPLKMRSQCSRCKNAPIPPMTKHTAEVTRPVI